MSAQPHPWANRIISSGVKPASEFLAHELNFKIHPQTQQNYLEGSLDQVGWFKSVVESARTGKLLDGHARIMLALRRGDETPVPYEVVDVSEEEEAIILASLDPLAALAVTDKEKLDALLREIPPVDARLQEMLAELAKREGLYPDESSDETGEAVTIPSQYIIMIECGSEAEQTALLERLLFEGIQCKALIS